MVNPKTVNVGIIVPLTGADVDLWGEDDVNPNMASIDGFIAGVQIISVSNVPITLTKPAGFTPTPGAGPTQSENRVLRLTGALSANVVITLPLPGHYIIDNQSTGNFTIQFVSVAPGEIIAIPQGERIEIYNDGVNVRFVNLARLGAVELWAGITGLPSWVSSCTVYPYLPCDGGVGVISSFPALGARLGSTFGGNGITTFGVPDLQGRVPLAYDGTGARITVAGCGINGQVLGAVNANAQSVTLVAGQIPSLTSVNPAQAISVTSQGGVNVMTSNGSAVTVSTPGSGAYGVDAGHPWSGVSLTSSANNNISVAYTNASPAVVNNVQPAIVTGIWVIKT